MAAARCHTRVLIRSVPVEKPSQEEARAKGAVNQRMSQCSLLFNRPRSGKLRVLWDIPTLSGSRAERKLLLPVTSEAVRVPSEENLKFVLWDCSSSCGRFTNRKQCRSHQRRTEERSDEFSTKKCNSVHFTM
ncbi:hypothetical protein RUM44_000285 [Polyplax serrata]|uniref:Uncharacterized protein n=1 Tax=Polyplax serrata TaxID=468196 RepID=A0ABR1B6F0_POLSC